MTKIELISVKYHDQLVGTLSLTPDNKLCAFEYAPSWLLEGFSISPLELPLRQGLFLAKPAPFYGNFGIFEDSLPDGYGRFCTLCRRIIWACFLRGFCGSAADDCGHDGQPGQQADPRPGPESEFSHAAPSSFPLLSQSSPRCPCRSPPARPASADRRIAAEEMQAEL